MSPETIIAELRRINAWRRGGEEIEQPDPTHMGEVLDAAAESLSSLIASNTTLRRERNESEKSVEHLKEANAVLLDDVAALRVANAELQKQEAESRRLFYAEQDKRQSAEYRIAELEAALRKLVAAEKKHDDASNNQTGKALVRAVEEAEDTLARPDAGEPAKHPDTEGEK